MATEVVTIVIRQVGAQATAAAIRGVGQESRTAAASVRIFSAALITLATGGTIAGLFGLQDVYIRLNNQLKFATSSQAEFNAVAKEVLQVANDTRAPLEDTALLYRRLRAATTAFGTSQADVLEVVKGLNAAILISGANAQEARGGLTQFTQALQSGRLAGDELRSLLENITPLAQAVARNLGLTLGELREQAKNIPVADLFRATQAAARDFNEQLNEVQFSASQTFNVLRNNLLDALATIDKAAGGTGLLNSVILKLANGIEQKLGRALGGLFNIFGSIFRSLADFIDALEDLGARRLPKVGQTARAALLSMLGFIQLIVTGAAAVLTAVAGVNDALVQVLVKAGVSTEEAGRESQAIFEAVTGTLVKASEGVNNTKDAFLGLAKEIGETGTVSKDASEALRSLGVDADLTASKIRTATRLQGHRGGGFDLNQPGVATPRAPSASELKEIERANARIARILDQLRVTEQKRIDPLNAQLEKLIQQRIELEKQARIAGVTKQVLEARKLSEQAIANIQQDQSDQSQRNVDLIVDLKQNIDEIRQFAPQIADQLERSAEAAVLLAGGGKAAEAELAKLLDRTQDILAERQGIVRDLGEGLVTGVAQPLGQALRGVLEGEAFNFAQVLSDASANLLQNAFDAITKDLATQVGEIFSKEFGSDVFGGAGFSAALGAGIGLIAGAFRDTSEEVSNNLARSSAVQDVQATRGIVAGPTNVPIFQVGESIEAAFLPTNAILLEIRDGIFSLAGLGPSEGGLGTDPAVSQLSRATPSLA